MDVTVSTFAGRSDRAPDLRIFMAKWLQRTCDWAMKGLYFSPVRIGDESRQVCIRGDSTFEQVGSGATGRHAATHKLWAGQEDVGCD